MHVGKLKGWKGHKLPNYTFSGVWIEGRGRPLGVVIHQTKEASHIYSQQQRGWGVGGGRGVGDVDGVGGVDVGGAFQTLPT